MSIPSPTALQKVIVDVIQAHGGKVRLCDLYKPVTGKFPQLTAADLDRRTPSGTNWWQGYIRFALDALKKKGVLAHPAHGVWGLSSSTSLPTVSSGPDAGYAGQVHSIQIALPSGGKAALTVPTHMTSKDVEVIHRVLSSLAQREAIPILPRSHYRRNI